MHVRKASMYQLGSERMSVLVSSVPKAAQRALAFFRVAQNSRKIYFEDEKRQKTRLQVKNQTLKSNSKNALLTSSKKSGFK